MVETKLELKPGMTVRVHQKIKELNSKGEEKERIQYFEGMIIARKHNKETGATITVRKVSEGIGVEKIFPLNLPTITKIEIKKQAEVKRAKLYYLRSGYKKKLKEKVVK
ncbi:MAG: 50S ribosomal protein L19 [Patescibacteria group bacterium]|jgi:large subunit ribosomal protein L19